MEILYLDESPSTHLELLEKLRTKELHAPIAVVADRQEKGVGSRANSWIGAEGNLFLSFAVASDTLPSDIPTSSLSIYFSFLMKEVLAEFGSSVFLKWPNDFYIGQRKVGGTITKLLNKGTIVCSMGINLKNAPENFEIIDINIEKKLLIESFFLKLKQDVFWKYIFRKYQVEFRKSHQFLYYDEVCKKKVSLKDAKLQEDGSIVLDGRKVYSLR